MNKIAIQGGTAAVDLGAILADPSVINAEQMYHLTRNLVNAHPEAEKLRQSLVTALTYDSRDGGSHYGTTMHDSFAGTDSPSTVYTSPYARSGAGATVALTFGDTDTQDVYVLLARKIDPVTKQLRPQYIMPGGYLDAHEPGKLDSALPYDKNLAATAVRELHEETGLKLPEGYEPHPLSVNSDYNVSNDPRLQTVKLFISATNVETGRAHVWDKKDLTADHVMASACLPWLFKAVEIAGVPYWDGGFTGNPALWPLFEHCESDDVVLVQINPIRRPGAPTTARDIINRVNEITFNAALLHDLRAMDFVARLMEAGRLEGTGYRRMLMHAIADEKSLAELGASSKFNVEPDFIDMLFGKGREAAENWLHTSFKHVGTRATVNIRRMFQGEDDSLDGGQLKPPRRKSRAAE